MVRVLGEFPQVHQTFNLVPSMMVQVEEYAAGRASDPFLQCALKPAESPYRGRAGLHPALLLPGQSFPHDSPLPALRGTVRRLDGGRPQRGARAPHVRSAGVSRSPGAVATGVVRRGQSERRSRGARSGAQGPRVQRGRSGARGAQAERVPGAPSWPPIRNSPPGGRSRFRPRLSTTPSCRLLCDSQIAEVAHPHVPLPSRFRYPQDARLQLERARSYVQEKFGATPAGLWPSEGSVSDEVLGIAADLGFRWAATDNGVLARTLARSAGLTETYRPYVWTADGREIRMVFRDHFLSDLVGFVYSRMGAAPAAADLVSRIRENCRGHPGRGTRRAGSHHSRWRERLGILRGKRAPIPAGTLPAASPMLPISWP